MANEGAEYICYVFEVPGELEGSTIELKPGGGSIPVDDGNKAEFVSLWIEHKLGAGRGGNLSALQRGFEAGLQVDGRSSISMSSYASPNSQYLPIRRF